MFQLVENIVDLWSQDARSLDNFYRVVRESLHLLTFRNPSCKLLLGVLSKLLPMLIKETLMLRYNRVRDEHQT